MGLNHGANVGLVGYLPLLGVEDGGQCRHLREVLPDQLDELGSHVGSYVAAPMGIEPDDVSASL